MKNQLIDLEHLHMLVQWFFQNLDAVLFAQRRGACSIERYKPSGERFSLNFTTKRLDIQRSRRHLTAKFQLCENGHVEEVNGAPFSPFAPLMIAFLERLQEETPMIRVIRRSQPEKTNVLTFRPNPVLQQKRSVPSVRPRSRGDKAAPNILMAAAVAQCDTPKETFTVADRVLARA